MSALQLSDESSDDDSDDDISEISEQPSIGEAGGPTAFATQHAERWGTPLYSPFSGSVPPGEVQAGHKAKPPPARRKKPDQVGRVCVSRDAQQAYMTNHRRTVAAAILLLHPCKPCLWKTVCAAYEHAEQSCNKLQRK